RRAFEIIKARSEEFATLISLEMGKPIAEARGEVTYGNEFLRWFSEEAVRISGRYGSSPEGTGRMLVTQRPVGPAFAITPWNFPLAMATRKIGPAIAAGCTMVIKPAELTPLTTLLLTSVFEEAGLPAGVLNVITTNTSAATSAPIISDPRLRKITFTGSTAVGVRLLEQSAKQVLRTSMELGGNAPFLVFEDADLDAAVDGAMLAKLRNIGQACTAANRFIVHESLADEFANRIAKRMEEMPLGRGVDVDTKIGPVINEKARANLKRLVDATVSEGGEIVTGGSYVDGDGYFFRPTVLANVKPGSTILNEEIFGPVAPIVRFKDEDEAIRLANDTEYGLVSYAYTQDLKRGLRLVEKLETGMTGLNTGLVSNAAAPFGGVKQSGLGREGGLEGIHEYLETKYVMIPDPSL
ncbi:MAG: NAD-dependent succinate-semialdehyde dehydrogenase, partial [Microbacteriaceae bacterium]|nr:NAD-dependent succinate-semialdehyde dehydrogenase [Microbacteriaceae bacterium]